MYTWILQRWSWGSSQIECFLRKESSNSALDSSSLLRACLQARTPSMISPSFDLDHPLFQDTAGSESWLRGSHVICTMLQIDPCSSLSAPFTSFKLFQWKHAIPGHCLILRSCMYSSLPNQKPASPYISPTFSEELFFLQYLSFLSLPSFADMSIIHSCCLLSPSQQTPSPYKDILYLSLPSTLANLRLYLRYMS